MSLRIAACVAILAAGCSSASPPAAVPQSPVPAPTPALLPAKSPKRLADGRVEYSLVLRAESGGGAVLPIQLLSSSGVGSVSWARQTEATFAYDAALDVFAPAPRERGGETRQELNSVAFAGSALVISLPVSYAGTPPATERFTLRYRTLPLGEIAGRCYVRPEKGAAGKSGEVVPRAPLGERVRSVEVYRWLEGGYFVREAPEVQEVTVTLAGVAAAGAGAGVEVGTGTPGP